MKSLQTLGFSLPSAIEKGEFDLYILNQIKNFLQYKFKKPVSNKKFIPDINQIKTSEPWQIVYKLRVLYHKDSRIEIESEKYDRNLDDNWLLGLLEKYPVNSLEVQHKFWPRPIFDFKNYQEIFWCNEKGEVCEGSFTNVYWQNEKNEIFTPSLNSGILPGVMRNVLLEYYPQIKETIISLKDFRLQKKFFISNALLGFKEVSLDH